MAFAVLQAVLSLGLAYLLWRGFKMYRCGSSIDHIPGPRQISLLLPGFGGFTDRDAWGFMDEIAERYGGVVQLRDRFGRKMLYVTDPLALHCVLVKEHHLYEESQEFLVATRLLFGPGILTSLGNAHRKQRKLMGSMFSLGALRDTTSVLMNVGEIFQDVITAQVKHRSKEINISSWCSRVILEMTGRSFFDHSFDPLVEEAHNTFATVVEDGLPSVYDVRYHFFIALTWVKTFGVTKLGQLIADHYPNTRVQKAKQNWDSLWLLAQQLAEEKTSNARKQHETRRSNEKSIDLFSLLVNANMSASDSDRLSEEEIVAQVNSIVFGAVETTSATVSRILHTLASHPDVQERLRKEIQEACDADLELSYDQIMELRFLDAVYRETVRVFPPVHAQNREAQDDTILPLWRPLTDVYGRTVQEVPIDKGTTVVIGIHGFNRSKAFWGDDATEWKPERWLFPLPESVRTVSSGGVFANTLTFVGGQRGCLGFKFAELMIKVTILHLLRGLRFSSGSEEIVWNTSRVVFPTTGKDKTEPSLLLMVESIQ